MSYVHVYVSVLHTVPNTTVASLIIKIQKSKIQNPKSKIQKTLNSSHFDNFILDP